MLFTYSDWLYSLMSYRLFNHHPQISHFCHVISPPRLLPLVRSQRHTVPPPRQGWRNDSRGGLGVGGPRGKGSPHVSKGPKPPIQLWQLLKNSPRKVKRAHFRYILGPRGSHPENRINGIRRERSLLPPPPPVSPAMPLASVKFLPDRDSNPRPWPPCAGSLST